MEISRNRVAHRSCSLSILSPLKTALHRETGGFFAQDNTSDPLLKIDSEKIWPEATEILPYQIPGNVNQMQEVGVSTLKDRSPVVSTCLQASIFMVFWKKLLGYYTKMLILSIENKRKKKLCLTSLMRSPRIISNRLTDQAENADILLPRFERLGEVQKSTVS